MGLFDFFSGSFKLLERLIDSVEVGFHDRGVRKRIVDVTKSYSSPIHNVVFWLDVF